MEEFHTSMKEIMIYTKYAKDRKKLYEAVYGYENFRKLERDAVEVINATTNSNLKYQENEEEIDVCLAIQEMREESMQQGIQLGEQRGIKQGVELLADAIKLMRGGMTETELRDAGKYSEDIIRQAVMLK